MESTSSKTNTSSPGGGIVKGIIQIDDETLRQLNKELNPQPAADEFTTYQYAGANTMTRDVAHYLLENGVRSGKLTRRTIKATVYYKKV